MHASGVGRVCSYHDKIYNVSTQFASCFCMVARYSQWLGIGSQQMAHLHAYICMGSQFGSLQLFILALHRSWYIPSQVAMFLRETQQSLQYFILR